MVTSSYMHPESDRRSSGIGCDRCRPHAHMLVSSVGTSFATFMDASSQRRIRYVTHGNTGSPSQKQVSVSTDCGIGTMHNVAVVLHASMHNVQPVAMMASSEADEFARSGHCRFVSLPFWMVKASKRIPLSSTASHHGIVAEYDLSNIRSQCSPGSIREHGNMIFS